MHVRYNCLLNKHKEKLDDQLYIENVSYMSKMQKKAGVTFLLYRVNWISTLPRASVFVNDPLMLHYIQICLFFHNHFWHWIDRDDAYERCGCHDFAD